MAMLTPEQYVLELVKANNPNAVVDYDNTTVIDPVTTDRYNRNTMAKLVSTETYLKQHQKEIWYNRIAIDDTLTVTLPSNLNSYGLLGEVNKLLNANLSEKDIIKDVYDENSVTGKIRMSKLNVAYTGEIKLNFKPTA